MFITILNKHGFVLKNGTFGCYSLCEGHHHMSPTLVLKIGAYILLAKFRVYCSILKDTQISILQKNNFNTV